MDYKNDSSFNIQKQIISGSINRTKSTTSFSVENLSAHDEIKLMKNEWEDIKDYSNKIVITPPSFDWINLFLGAAISTGVTAGFQLFDEFTKELTTSTSTIWHVGITFALLIAVIISFLSQKKVSNKQNDSKVHSEYLKQKIIKIEKRLSKD